MQVLLALSKTKVFIALSAFLVLEIEILQQSESVISCVSERGRMNYPAQALDSIGWSLVEGNESHSRNAELPI